jgi:hypothetical protein
MNFARARFLSSGPLFEKNEKGPRHFETFSASELCPARRKTINDYQAISVPLSR